MAVKASFRLPAAMTRISDADAEVRADATINATSQTRIEPTQFSSFQDAPSIGKSRPEAQARNDGIWNLRLLFKLQSNADATSPPPPAAPPALRRVRSAARGGSRSRR